MTRTYISLFNPNKKTGWAVAYLWLLAFALKAQGPLQLTMSFTAPSCAGDANGSATANVSGGTFPYSYQWSNGGQTSTIEGLSAGTYTVTVTDNAGTTRVGSIQVTQPLPIYFNLVVNVPSCNGFPATMTMHPFGGTPPYSVEWSHGVQGPTANNLMPMSIYIITVTDANGCQRDTAICPPTMDSLKVQLVIKRADCEGVNNGTATALVNPPAGNYRYTWNVSPLNTHQVTGLAAGTQVAVTVTDQITGCTGTASGVIGALSKVNLKVSGTQKLNCANDRNGVLTANATNGSAPYTYIWQGPGVNGASGQTLTGLGPGTYSVTATDARGCTAAANTAIGVITDLKADFTLSKFCADTLFYVKFINAATSTPVIVLWEWRIVWNGGSVQSNQPNVTVPLPNRTSGLATLIVTNSEGCTDTITKPFAVDSLLDFKIVTPGLSCDGSAVPITVLGDSAFTYTWTPTDFLTFNPGPQQVLASPPATTKYRLTVSNGDCTSTDTVLILRQPLLELTATGDETCGEPGTLKATTNLPATIVWTTLTGDTINPLSAPPGTYRAIATDTFKCTRTATADVVARTPNFSATVPPNACPNDPFNLNAQNLIPADTLFYQWSANPPTLIIANPNNASTTAAGPLGNYTLTLIAFNQKGCTDTLTFPVNIQDSLNVEPSLSVQQACDSYRANFANTSGLPGVWNFGDGNTANSNGADTLTHLYAAPGDYNATFTPASGCAKPAKLSLQITDNIFNVSAPDVTGCQPTAALTATTNQPGTVVWTTITGQPVANPNAVPAGVYVATATDVSGLCTAVDTAVVTLQDSIDLTGQVSAQEQCNSAEIVFNNTSGVPGVWNFGDGVGTSTAASGTYTYAAFGTYTVTFTPGADCALPVSIEVSPSEEDFTVEAPDVVGCEPSASLVATTNLPGTVVWTTITGQPVLNPDAVPAGVYIAIAMDSMGLCVAKDTAEVRLLDSIDISAQVSITPLCNSLRVIFENTSGYPGVWDFGDGTQSNQELVEHTYAATGLYPVSLVSSELCVMPFAMVLEVKFDSFTVTAPDVTACGYSAELQATTSLPGTVIWYDAQGNIVDPSGVEEGIYIVVATDLSGQCTATDTVQVRTIVVEVTAEVIGKDTLCRNDTTTLLATVKGNASNYVYSWTPAQTLIGANTPMPLAVPNGPQTYTVTVTADGLCVDTASVQVYFIEYTCTEPYVFIPKAFTPNGDGNNDYFRVRGADITEIYFIVYTRWGEEVYRTEDPNHIGWDGTFRGKLATPDAYGWYVRVRCGNGQWFESKGSVTLLR